MEFLYLPKGFFEYPCSLCCSKVVAQYSWAIGLLALSLLPSEVKVETVEEWVEKWRTNERE